MKIPLSSRLSACAELVRSGARVADIGCDHGYLGISLLKNGIAEFVYASDLREKPLQKARENAARFGVAENIEFCLGDGLESIRPGQVDTIVMAGMGGDKIAAILDAAPWVRDEKMRLILQPQSSANDLRRWLGENSYRIERENLVLDGGFQYAVMLVAYGGGERLSPGEQYCSKQLMQSGSDLLIPYLDRVIPTLARTVENLRKANDPAKLAYYSTALEELEEMRKTL